MRVQPRYYDMTLLRILPTASCITRSLHTSWWKHKTTPNSVGALGIVGLLGALWCVFPLLGEFPLTQYRRGWAGSTSLELLFCMQLPPLRQAAQQILATFAFLNFMPLSSQFKKARKNLERTCAVA